jgi:hypothetical protein
MLPILSALLTLAPPVAADTGVELCKDWSVTPDTITTSFGNEHLFRIDTLRQCRSDLDCVWSMTTELGELESDSGLNVWWNAPSEPPDECEPLDSSLVATCVLWGSYTRTASADIQVRCTDDERDQLAEERAALLSVQGGGCTSPQRAEALLLLLPLGLFGLRRRL